MLAFWLVPIAHSESPVDPCEGQTAQQHRSAASDLLDSTYDEQRWRKAHPLGPATRRTLELHASCSGEEREVDRVQAKAKQRFYEHRRFRQVTPYHCGFGGEGSPAPGYFAIPCNVVCGESRGNFHVNADGAYQIIPSTWRSFGGGKYAPNAGAATPLEQSIVARRAWGKTPWYGNRSDC